MQGSHLGCLHSLAAACLAVSLLLPSGCKVPGARGCPTLGTMCFHTGHSRLVLECAFTPGCTQFYSVPAWHHGKHNCWKCFGMCHLSHPMSSKAE